MIGQDFSSCDPFPLTFHTKVRTEVYQPIVNLPWLQVGQRGTITLVQGGHLCDTGRPSSTSARDYCLDSSNNLAWYIHRPPPIPPPTHIQYVKVHLSVKQQSSVRGICETRMWRVHEITPSATSTQLVMHDLSADAPGHWGGNLSYSCTQFPLETVIQLLKETEVVLAADASASVSEAALPNVDNLDLGNMPSAFDYEGDETSWEQGLPSGQVGPQLGELEMSKSDGNSSAVSILGVSGWIRWRRLNVRCRGSAQQHSGRSGSGGQ